MTVKISHTEVIQRFFKEAAGFSSDNGNPRLKSIILRILQDSARIIEDLDITEDEFWKSVDYLNRLGGRSEAGLLVAGLGIEHFIDLLQDAKDEQAGQTGGTPRTIDGPLYVAGAPVFERLLTDWRRAGVTVVWIEHDLAAVKRLAERVTGLNRQVLFDGAPEQTLSPERLLTLFSTHPKAHGSALS